MAPDGKQRAADALDAEAVRTLAQHYPNNRANAFLNWLTQPSLTLADIREVTGISTAAIQKLLNHLTAKNYVERADKDGSWRVFLTQ